MPTTRTVGFRTSVRRPRRSGSTKQAINEPYDPPPPSRLLALRLLPTANPRRRLLSHPSFLGTRININLRFIFPINHFSAARAYTLCAIPIISQPLLLVPSPSPALATQRNATPPLLSPLARSPYTICSSPSCLYFAPRALLSQASIMTILDDDDETAAATATATAMASNAAVSVTGSRRRFLMRALFDRTRSIARPGRHTCPPLVLVLIPPMLLFIARR